MNEQLGRTEAAACPDTVRFRTESFIAQEEHEHSGIVAAKTRKIRAAEPGLSPGFPVQIRGNGTMRSAGRRTADIVSIQVLNLYHSFCIELYYIVMYFINFLTLLKNMTESAAG